MLYKGTGPAFTDLLGGTISGMLDPLLTSLPLAQGKQATALAIASAKRSPLAPDVPTFGEAGYPGFEFYTWYGLWGPAHLPPDIVTTDLARAERDRSIGRGAKMVCRPRTRNSGLGGAAFVDFSRSEQKISTPTS